MEACGSDYGGPGLMKVLVIQTAFLGDVVLSTPMFDALRESMPEAEIDVVVTPAGAQALFGHPSLSTIHVFDKKGRQRGLSAFLSLARDLRGRDYQIAVIPHRSLRSGLLAWCARIPRRIGFDRSSARRMLTDVVEYRSQDHEIDRNLSLLVPLGIVAGARRNPSLSPQPQDDAAVEAIVHGSMLDHGSLLTIAPGSVWNTKRWPWERYAELVRLFERRGHTVALIGGPEDAELCRRILREADVERSFSTAGTLSVLQSTALIRRSRALVTNDSAPLHLASAVGTPVVAIFGATSPSYGFGPRGPQDQVIEVLGLPCRPCAVHGGNRCPIGTFECMLTIDAERVATQVLGFLSSTSDR